MSVDSLSYSYRLPNSGKSYSGLWTIICLGLIYKAILDIGYAVFIVTPRYAGELYVYAPGVFKEVLSYVLVTLIFAFLYFDRKRGRPSRLVIYLYTIMIICPLLTLFGLGDASTVFVFACLSCIVVLTLASRLRVPFGVAPLGRTGVWAGFAILICVGLFVYGNLVTAGGLGRLNFNLVDSSLIYRVRAEYVATTNHLMGYLLFWQSDISDTILLLIALRKRSVMLLALALFLQAALFGMTNFKMMAFVPVFVVFVYLFFENGKFIKILMLACSVVLIFSFVLDAYSNSKVLVDLISDRVFYFPAQLHMLYYRFFSVHEHMHLSNSILSWLVQNPYHSSMPSVIARSFFDSAGSPNTGFLATTYAEFGVGGMFVFSLILGYLLAVYDAVTAKVSPRIAAALIAAPALSFTNSAMFTTLLTGGFLFALLEAWLFTPMFGSVLLARRARLKAKSLAAVASN